MNKVRSRFREVDGQIIIGPERHGCRTSATMRADSVDPGVPPRDADLRSGSFLDVEPHPDVTVASTAVEGSDDSSFTVVGDLTIPGTTREVSLQAEFLGRDTTGWQGEPRIWFAARTTIRRSDFWAGERSVKGSKIVVGDTVTIELDVEASLDECAAAAREAAGEAATSVLAAGAA
jgi:polyisoprenoid-binding protein YceI